MKHLDFKTAQKMLMDHVHPVQTERLPLSLCGGRILAEDLLAAGNIPPFDRSPYDGYAFRAADSAAASPDAPVSLTILEELPAGSVPTRPVLPGTAVKILTGAPIPAGADVVCKYEDTRFDLHTVTLSRSYRAGENIVHAGEDIREGELLARKGTRIDGGLAGTLASQGISSPLVYRRLRVGILCTGSEVVECSEIPSAGKIRNANRHTLETILEGLGFEPVYLGLAGDDLAAIAALVQNGLAQCDAVISTGGVSVGDYDLTPDAMKQTGVEMLFQGVDLKPGMACAYGIQNGKPVCALSGNPASAITNFYAVALPALRKMAGLEKFEFTEITVTLAQSFHKKSPCTRLLRGKLDLSDGTVRLQLPQKQGNVVLSSSIGCNAMAVVPADSGPIDQNTPLKGFLLT